MHIDFQDNTNAVNEKQLTMIEELLSFAAKDEKVQEDAELSLTFVSNREIQELNRDYRGKDTPTDVISFALEEEGEEELQIYDEEIPIILGDIVISIDRAKEQAEEYGHPLERELGFLALHGFLHLLGYDHMKEEEEKKMFSRQEEILNAYGLSR